MTSIDALLLGALQGVTEFLPVSSSGHLRLAEVALSDLPSSLLFDVSLHMGTLVAVVIVFRRELASIVAGLRPSLGVPWREREAVRLLGLMLLASVPTAVIGLLLEPLVGHRLAVWGVGAALVVNGGVLLATARAGRRVPATAEPDGTSPWSGLSAWQALAIGVAQGIAVLPGISRSGSTIATALLLGVAWRPAAVFSFLLSIPAILGALVLELRHWEGTVGAQPAPLVLGVAAALAFGLMALSLLLRLLRSGRLYWFGVYSAALGAVALVWGLSAGV